MTHAGGWTVLAELPEASRINDFRATGNGEYVFELLEEIDGILYMSDISVDLQGNQTVNIQRREIHISEDQPLVLEHEILHYQNRHHIDNMLYSILHILFWINPLEALMLPLISESKVIGTVHMSVVQLFVM